MRILSSLLLCSLQLLLAVSVCITNLAAQDSPSFKSDWEQSSLGGVSRWFEIRGTGNRNNPIRRSLRAPFKGRELFVRFRIRYEASSVDEPREGDGEFFVLWFDEADGGDTAVHSGGVPNVGVHVDDQRNAWMARFDSSKQAFGEEPFVGGKEFTVITRLSKSSPSDDAPFDRLAVWIDPRITDLDTPEIVTSSKRSINAVQWIGFATGRKTEASDRIGVSQIDVSKSWHGAMGLPEFEKDEVTKNAGEAPDSQQVAKFAEPTVSFTQQIYPILRERCFACHAGKDPDSGVRLDSYDDLLNQLTPRNADASHLIELVKSKDAAERMPPDGVGLTRLSQNEIALLRTWVNEGVSWDHGLLPTPAPSSDHWAFQSLGEVEVPGDGDSGLVRTPVDSIILSRHKELGIRPSERADWRTLQRRIALDLTGLPPSEFEGLCDSEDDESLDRSIELLLSSDAHGERWARHWLDVARWAESNGYQHNRFRPHAWRYRDYVVQAFKNDMPFDQFVREQLAGDLIAAERASENQSSTDSRFADQLIATGYLAAARYSGNELDKEIQRNDILVDVANTTAKSFLGITLECAQCHTHKFDPISIRDYYRFQAFFADGQPGNLVLQPKQGTLEQVIEMRWSLFEAVRHRLVERKRKAGVPAPVLVIPKSVVPAMKPAEREAFDDLESVIAEYPQAWSWIGANADFAVAPHEMRWPLPRDPGRLRQRTTYVRLRGNVKSVGPAVEPGWPEVFGRTPPTDSGRRSLANWIASPRNPLTARVWVNRIWQWHFGRGLVETSGDFGATGSTPTHPKLLDWLAVELIESGWSTRHIHRLILCSNTYRQSAAFSESNFRTDPGNKLWWRWSPRRLEAEAIRDSSLSVAAMIDRKVGGPSVPTDNTDTSNRRSIYLRQHRQRIPDSLALFDSPSSVTACSRRRTSTVALQPLYLLNSPRMQELSKRFADRVRKVAGERDVGTVAFEIALARGPDHEETEKLRMFLRDSPLEDLCLALLNLNEFVYLP